MKMFFKRMISIRVLVVVLGLTASFAFTGLQKVSAEVQTKMPYLIKVNRVHNTITVYEKDKNGLYNNPIKSMVCSVGAMGTQTKLGTFQTKAKYRWKELMGDVWGQYSTRIVGGILFHSVYYYRKDPSALATKEFNKLGSAASHGCIRLTVEDAKWIYDNCAVGTTVVIYDDKKSPGPLGKPVALKIPTNVYWDPTDPSENNPYRDKSPKITGAKSLEVDWGKEINLLKDVKAKSTLGADITSKLTVKGDIDYYLPGKYKVAYYIKDELGKTSKKSITVTVRDYPETPKFTGIWDKIVGYGIEIDEEFAMAGVEAYCKKVKLKNELIDISINQISEVEYQITYEIRNGKKVAATSYGAVYVDTEAPVFSGIEGRILEYGVVPDEEYVLSGVTVSDNYTTSEQLDITVSIEANTDGSYLITYESVDEVGNAVKVQYVMSAWSPAAIVELAS